MDRKDIFRQHLEALGRGDWQTYRSLLTDDAIYEEEATSRRVQGADPYLATIKQWRVTFPDLKATVREIVASGDAIVAEVEYEGTHRGSFAGPFGTIPPSGLRGKVPAVIVARFDGDRIRELHNYFDLLTLLRQMNALPGTPVTPRP